MVIGRLGGKSQTDDESDCLRKPHKGELPADDLVFDRPVRRSVIRRRISVPATLAMRQSICQPREPFRWIIVLTMLRY